MSGSSGQAWAPARDPWTPTKHTPSQGGKPSPKRGPTTIHMEYDVSPARDVSPGRDAYRRRGSGQHQVTTTSMQGIDTNQHGMGVNLQPGDLQADQSCSRWQQLKASWNLSGQSNLAAWATRANSPQPTLSQELPPTSSLSQQQQQSPGAGVAQPQQAATAAAAAVQPAQGSRQPTALARWLPAPAEMPAADKLALYTSQLSQLDQSLVSVRQSQQPAQHVTRQSSQRPLPASPSLRSHHRPTATTTSHAANTTSHAASTWHPAATAAAGMPAVWPTAHSQPGMPPAAAVASTTHHPVTQETLKGATEKQETLEEAAENLLARVSAMQCLADHRPAAATAAGGLPASWAGLTGRDQPPSWAGRGGHSQPASGSRGRGSDGGCSWAGRAGYNTMGVKEEAEIDPGLASTVRRILEGAQLQMLDLEFQARKQQLEEDRQQPQHPQAPGAGTDPRNGQPRQPVGGASGPTAAAAQPAAATGGAAGLHVQHAGAGGGVAAGTVAGDMVAGVRARWALRRWRRGARIMAAYGRQQGMRAQHFRLGRLLRAWRGAALAGRQEAEAAAAGLARDTRLEQVADRFCRLRLLYQALVGWRAGARVSAQETAEAQRVHEAHLLELQTEQRHEQVARRFRAAYMRHAVLLAWHGVAARAANERALAVDAARRKSAISSFLTRLTTSNHLTASQPPHQAAGGVAKDRAVSKDVGRGAAVSKMAGQGAAMSKVGGQGAAVSKVAGQGGQGQPLADAARRAAVARALGPRAAGGLVTALAHGSAKAAAAHSKLLQQQQQQRPQQVRAAGGQRARLPAAAAALTEQLVQQAMAGVGSNAADVGAAALYQRLVQQAVTGAGRAADTAQVAAVAHYQGPCQAEVEVAAGAPQCREPYSFTAWVDGAGRLTTGKGQRGLPAHGLLSPPAAAKESSSSAAHKPSMRCEGSEHQGSAHEDGGHQGGVERMSVAAFEPTASTHSKAEVTAHGCVKQPAAAAGAAACPAGAAAAGAGDQHQLPPGTVQLMQLAAMLSQRAQACDTSLSQRAQACDTSPLQSPAVPHCSHPPVMPHVTQPPAVPHVTQPSLPHHPVAAAADVAVRRHRSTAGSEADSMAGSLCSAGHLDVAARRHRSTAGSEADSTGNTTHLRAHVQTTGSPGSDVHLRSHAQAGSRTSSPGSSNTRPTRAHPDSLAASPGSDLHLRNHAQAGSHTGSPGSSKAHPHETAPALNEEDARGAISGTDALWNIERAGRVAGARRSLLCQASQQGQGLGINMHLGAAARQPRSTASSVASVQPNGARTATRGDAGAGRGGRPRAVTSGHGEAPGTGVAAGSTTGRTPLRRSSCGAYGGDASAGAMWSPGAAAGTGAAAGAWSSLTRRTPSRHTSSSGAHAIDSTGTGTGASTGTGAGAHGAWRSLHQGAACGDADAARLLCQARSAAQRRRRSTAELLGALGGQLMAEAVELAELHYQRALVIRCGLRPWLHLVAARHVQSQQADLHHRTQALRLAWGGWRRRLLQGAWSRAVGQAAGVARVRGRCQAHIATSCLRRWHGWTQAGRLTRQRLTGLVLASLSVAVRWGRLARRDAVLHARARGQGRVMRLWRAEALRQAGERLVAELQLTEAVESKVRLSRLRRVLQAWQAAAGAAREEAEVAARQADTWRKVQGWLSELGTPGGLPVGGGTPGGLPAVGDTRAGSGQAEAERAGAVRAADAGLGGGWGAAEQVDNWGDGGLLAPPGNQALPNQAQGTLPDKERSESWLQLGGVGLGHGTGVTVRGLDQELLGHLGGDVGCGTGGAGGGGGGRRTTAISLPDTTTCSAAAAPAGTEQPHGSAAAGRERVQAAALLGPEQRHRLLPSQLPPPAQHGRQPSPARLLTRHPAAHDACLLDAASKRHHGADMCMPPAAMVHGPGGPGSGGGPDGGKAPGLRESLSVLQARASHARQERLQDYMSRRMDVAAPAPPNVEHA